MRKTKKDEYYFSLKLIGGPEGQVLTSIHDSKRRECSPEDIAYGLYCDQYISPTCVIFGPDGIRTVWSAHQVVTSNVEKIFLSSCLLDSVTDNPHPVQTYPYSTLHSGDSSYTSFPLPPPPPPPLGATPGANTMRQAQTVCRPMINMSDLKSAISKLKAPKIDIVEDGLDELDLVESEQGMEKRKLDLTGENGAMRDIMNQSIAGFPVEGE